MKFKIIIATLVLTLSFGVLSAPNAVTAYSRKADLAQVAILAKVSDLKDLVKAMEQSNVKIYKVPKDSVKKHFDFLETIPVSELPDLELRLDEVDTESAMFITQNEIKGAKTNIILIASDADPVTVLHEFSHHLFETQNHHETEQISEDMAGYGMLLKRFNFKTRKVMMDFSLLADKRWRDEIKDIIEEYTDMMNKGQGVIAAEEIAIETALLDILVKTNSHYLNYERAHNGIEGYSRGLVIRSEGLARNIIALTDLVMVEGIIGDPEATEEEKSDWEKRSLVINSKINAYIDGPLSRMITQVNASAELLKKIKPAGK